MEASLLLSSPCSLRHFAYTYARGALPVKKHRAFLKSLLNYRFSLYPTKDQELALEQTPACYAGRYDLIFLERLKAQNMTRNHSLARKMLDSSWSAFKMMCQYKANRVVEVEPAYSYIECSRCGCKVPKSIAVRMMHVRIQRVP